MILWDIDLKILKNKFNNKHLSYLVVCIFLILAIIVWYKYLASKPVNIDFGKIAKMDYVSASKEADRIYNYGQRPVLFNGVRVDNRSGCFSLKPGKSTGLGPFGDGPLLLVKNPGNEPVLIWHGNGHSFIAGKVQLYYWENKCWNYSGIIDRQEYPKIPENK